MKKKIMTLTIVVLYLFWTTSTSFAVSEDELKQQKAEAQERKNVVQYQIDMKQTTMEGIKNELDKAEAEIKKINDNIANCDKQIESIDSQLEIKYKKLAETELKQQKQQDDMQGRLRVMYMYGNESYLSVLFTAQSLVDFITRADLVRFVAQADREALDELKITEQQLQAQHKDIEADKSNLVKIKEEQNSSLANQENIKTQEAQLLAQNQIVVDQLQSEADKQQEILNQASTELSRIAYEREQAAREQLNNMNSSDSSNDSSSEDASGNTSDDNRPDTSAGLIWPISSAYYPDEWDDMFGDRIHPITGVWTWHSGADMGAPTGTPVWAPSNGVVTFAGYNGGFGNCVMVAVDGGTVLYGHLSQIYVSEGQYVSKGENVGAVGDTGNSTGPHLHLSFLVDGDYVDPLNYMHW